MGKKILLDGYPVKNLLLGKAGVKLADEIGQNLTGIQNVVGKIKSLISEIVEERRFELPATLAGSNER